MTESSSPAPRGKKKTDWAKLSSRKATAPLKEIEAEDAQPPAQPVVPEGANVRVTPTGKVVPATKPQTFRLPLDVFKIIADEKALAAAEGDKLTNDAIVTEAVRMWKKTKDRQRAKG